MDCSICYNEMDMNEYQDEHESTETCFKLECGHAYHTKCIVSFLTRTTHKCPSCNKHKTPQEKLEREFIIRELAGEVLKDTRFKELKHEYNQGILEYKQVLCQLRKDAKELVEKRARELRVYDYRAYYIKVKHALFSSAKTIAKELGPRYIGAINSEDRQEGRQGRDRRPGESPAPTASCAAQRAVRSACAAQGLRRRRKAPAFSGAQGR